MMKQAATIFILAVLQLAAQTSGVMNGLESASSTLGAKVGSLDNEIVLVQNKRTGSSGITTLQILTGASQGPVAPFQIGTTLSNLFSVSSLGDAVISNQRGVAYWDDPSVSVRIYSRLDGAEGGADSGSNYVVLRYSDAGALLGTPLFIQRSNGYVGINSTSPTAQLDVGGTMHADPGGTVPAWAKYALVKIANGVNGCANADGCWQVNGVLGPNASAALTQDVVLFQLPAKGFVDASRVKSNTACTGTASALTGVGAAGTIGFFRSRDYDIQAVVSDTNLTNELTNPGSTTAAAVNAEANLVTTVQNIDQLVAGCAVDYWVKWAVLP